MQPSAVRIERDSMGELEVPADALWGAQTQRALGNFTLSGRPLPRAFLRALALVKLAAARANATLGLLDAALADAIAAAALEVADGRHDAHFPLDVFQTGSGTSSNITLVCCRRLHPYARGSEVHGARSSRLSWSASKCWSAAFSAPALNSPSITRLTRHAAHRSSAPMRRAPDSAMRCRSANRARRRRSRQAELERPGSHYNAAR